MEEGSLTFKYLEHKNPDGLCDGKYQGEKNHDLGNAEYSHFSPSKTFRSKQRVHQINKEKHGGDACNCVFHGSSSKALSGSCETPHQSKEDNYDSNIKNIPHN